MYAASNLTQIQPYKPKAKSDIKTKGSEKNSQFDQSLSLAFEGSSVQKRISSDLKKEPKPTQKAFDKQDERALTEADLVNEQVAMTMFVLNANNEPLFDINQNNQLSGLFQNNEELISLFNEQGAIKLESPFTAEEILMPTDNLGTIQNLLGKGNALFTANIQEGIEIPFEMKNILEPTGLNQPIKTETTLSQFNETLNQSFISKPSEIKPSKNGNIKNSAELMINTQKDALQEENKAEMLSEISGRKQESLDYSKINIKVGESTINADSNLFGKDIAEKILHHASNGKNIFEVQLNPKELGSIQIKLTFESGKASVVLNCSNPKTQELLMGQSENIRHIIEQQTGSDTIVTVKEEAYRNQQDFDGRGQNSRQEEQRQQPQKDDPVNAEQFLQQLKLGLLGREDMNYGFD
ncbi:flagellar hook-length control protein FliK [Anaerovorax sp. IOR16]|uniref:flagellar hook-length control protein FliK n=1 Tax=Anaerovorax sp. IOR16 TaxID=2773458 RepID=UPI0019CFEAAA|nr:flagellar hook-length control protein FliK [Anaerovorax sp. IOR16]